MIDTYTVEYTRFLSSKSNLRVQRQKSAPLKFTFQVAKKNTKAVIKTKNQTQIPTPAYD